ncbi:MAG: hypothetical protein NT098_00575 [Candidatus Parcubacteria bacterium]|nr:hypothetical protein [Candidatus Parcubacteria bacterium]
MAIQITDPCAGCPYAVEHIACLRSLPDDFCRKAQREEPKQPVVRVINFEAVETD